MANSDKDIKITPNTNQAEQPKIEFVGSSSAPITLNVLDDNSLSFEGSEGQLFSISDNLTSGTIFSVNDVSGLSSIKVNADGNIILSEYGARIDIGTVVSSDVALTGTLAVVGTLSASSYIGIPPAEITAAGNNTFTGINTFDTNYITASVGITGSTAEFTTVSASLAEISQRVEVKSSVASDVNTLNVGVDRSLLPNGLDVDWHDYSKINFTSLSESNRTSVLSVLQKSDASIYGTLGIASYSSGSSVFENDGLFVSTGHYGASTVDNLNGIFLRNFVNEGTLTSATNLFCDTYVNNGGTISFNHALYIGSPTINSGSITTNRALYIADQATIPTYYNNTIHVDAYHNGFFTPFTIGKHGHVNIGADGVEDHKLFIREYVNNTNDTLGLIDTLSIDQSNTGTKNFHQNIRSRTWKEGIGITDFASSIFGYYRAVASSGGTVERYYAIHSRVDDEVGASVTFNTASMFVAEQPILQGSSTINNLIGVYIEPLDVGVNNYAIYYDKTATGNDFVVTGEGKVGIGIINPTHELVVVGTISASNYLGIDVTAAGNNTFTGINTFDTNYITASVGITGSTAEFTTVSASVISASAYVGLPPAEITAAGNNTFTGINTFDTNYITASVGITGSTAEFTTVSASVISGSIIESTKDIIVDDSTRGIVLKSPDANYWRITVDNTGSLTVTSLGATKPT